MNPVDILTLYLWIAPGYHYTQLSKHPDLCPKIAANMSLGESDMILYFAINKATEKI